MNLAKINDATPQDALTLFYECCATHAFGLEMVAERPFADKDSLMTACDRIWWAQTEDVWLEAFEGHPKIGDIDSLRAKYANTKATSASEQSGVDGADEQTLAALKELNESYEQKFGFIFIVCASGKSAAEMLMILKERIDNDRNVELKNAAAEQLKITKLRLEKL